MATNVSITPESVVQALLPHLTRQTALLPTLHSQLGLSPSALETDLIKLKDSLIKTIDSCLQTRQREVQEWLDRCDGVEEACMRLSRALGHSSKSIKAAVAELRKQTVYPKRHEYLTNQEDKLLQLYQSKLEQLHNLTARVTNLSQTLGPDFYTSDILNPTPSDGAEEDTDAFRDVTPERFMKLEKELARGKTEVGRRLAHLSKIMETIALLYDDLGVPFPVVGESVPGEEFPFPRPYASKVTSSTDPFAPNPDPLRQRAEYFPLFAQFIAKIQEAEEEALNGETIGVEGIDPTLLLVEWFENLRTDLEQEKSYREAHIQSLYDQLEILWKRLGIEDQDIEDFIELNRGSTMVNVRAYENELERMLEMKREKMSVFIGNARTEIEKLWDDLMAGQMERDTFAAFYDDEHTESLLAIHEEEILRLKKERKSKAPLLVSARKYFQILDEQKELEVSASDQSRLLGRGVRGDPGRLLREEKMRKRVMKDKPKIEQDLMEKVPLWEQEHGKQFFVNGVSLVSLLEEKMYAEEANKDSKKRPRVPSTTGRATPALPGRKGAVTPLLRSASVSSNSASLSHSSGGPINKRQKLNNSTSNPTPLSQVVSAPNLRSTSKNSKSGQRENERPRSALQRPIAAAAAANVVQHTNRKPLGVLPSNTPPRAYTAVGRPGSPGKASSIPKPVGQTQSGRGLLFPTKVPPAVVEKSNRPGMEEKEGRRTGSSGTSSSSTTLSHSTSSLFMLQPSVTAPAIVVAPVSGAAVVGGPTKLRSSGRRDSFKPRPSSPGLGSTYAEMWKGKKLLREEAVEELEEDSDYSA